MKKVPFAKAAAAACAAALAASACAVPMAFADPNPIGGTSRATSQEDISPSPAAIDTKLYTRVTNGTAGSPDTIKGGWEVTIPESVALTKDGNDGLPGTYTGTATISWRGTIGTKQTLSIASGPVTLKDSKGWSNDIDTCAHTDSGLTDIAPADNLGTLSGSTGTTAFSVNLAPGNWTGLCTYTISIS